MKKIMKLKRMNNLKHMLYDMVNPSGGRKRLRNDPDFKDSDNANLSEESDIVRNAFFDEIEGQMEVLKEM